MTRQILMLVLCALGLAACGGGQDPAPATDAAAEQKVAAGEADYVRTPANPGTRFRIDYRIIGTPIVGSPVSIDLEIQSALGSDPVDISYQVPDPSALSMDESQPRALTRAPVAGESVIRERVTVVPQREGRLFINVRAGRSGGDGSNSTMISIPVHVGEVDTSIREHGELQTNEEGETTRVLESE